ncbi:SNF2 family DNA or RNA helicase [Methylohalomonas lacus]|uniref:SNF2 family DNA or RNA helicase n=1 Tax=Methylohalomonas lacus TaxID=398773 RepID=A0AAE3HK97_9GAMM|nr:SNF2-related protein [Methylohalomonas lacus]MCS3903861.1 SNF2 family DNA or RNA helicase [Methylohalomonas lacus]
MITEYQAKYFAWELTRRRRGYGDDRIVQSLFDASVDLNPHQIDAALFALQNPLTKGHLLADEVGLGKTIEAALVLAQYWAERRRNLLVICPASLRKQWANELAEKFHLDTQILDARRWKQLRKEGFDNPLSQDWVNIISYNFAVNIEKQLSQVPWDLVVMDEAQKLRNAHRDSHKSGQSIKRSLAGSRKLLLTATPLQNSLLEIYGLSTIIDEHLFGDAVSFRSQYMRSDGDLQGLKHRLRDFTKRTLRRQVLEYIQYTERRPLTIPFEPSDEEQRLYDLVSGYLQREDCYGFPPRQRHLIGLVLRKLLASSTEAVTATLQIILERLQKLEQQKTLDDDWLENLLSEDDIDEEILEETGSSNETSLACQEQDIDPVKLRGEIAEIEQYIQLARSIKEDKKSYALLHAIETGFERMREMGAPTKAVIFTESRRTQEYLARFLESHGFRDKVITFSGSNTSSSATGIYQRWLKNYAGSDRVTGSAAIDRRTALVDYFRDQGEIMIATEAGAEGINLQFCALVINYDLPWNPQRVEQRIGRCHRYGQKFDVVVINFMNQRNAADRRVLELLSEKFHLFDGVFGASDEILGRIESGVDFEKRISEIYETCRTPQEIEAAFTKLRSELEGSIESRMRETEQKLLEHFDANIHELLKVRRERAEENLDRISKLFWQLTRYILNDMACFEQEKLAFNLQESPTPAAEKGEYRLIRKGEAAPEHAHLYRLSHPLGEYVLDAGRRLETPSALVKFDLSGHALKISVLEQLSTKSGWLDLNLLELEIFEREEYLVFTGLADDGTTLDQEACEQLFTLAATVESLDDTKPPQLLESNAQLQLQAKRSQALDENNEYFQREREKLEQWADDQIMAAEQTLHDTKIKIRDTKRRARTAATVEEQKQLQEELKRLESQQRRQRQEIFDVEDDIEKRRDELIAALEKRLQQRSVTHHLFRIRWELA